MNTKPVTVLAILKAKPGQEAVLRKELLGLLGPSHKDAGCINYDLHQSAGNPAQFLFHENWASKALLDAHIATPHVQGLFSKADTLLAEPPQVTFWERIG